VSTDAVQADNLRIGCGTPHDPADRCGTAGCHGRPGDDTHPTSQQLRAALTSRRHQLAAADRDVTLLTLRLIAHAVGKASHRIACVGLEQPDSHPDRLPPAGTYLTKGRHLFPNADRRRQLDDAIADYTTQITHQHGDLAAVHHTVEEQRGAAGRGERPR